jgi:hypothetical protein
MRSPFFLAQVVRAPLHASWNRVFIRTVSITYTGCHLKLTPLRPPDKVLLAALSLQISSQTRCLK